MINRKEFASIAEAVAYYYQRGYKTTAEVECGRVMIKGRNEVIIYREEFLKVIGEEYIPEIPLAVSN